MPLDPMVEPDAVDRLRQTVAEKLVEMAVATGDARFNRAAGALRGRPGGRHRIADTDGVAQIAELLAADPSLDVTRAARLVAKTRRETATIESVTARLAKRYRAAHGEK